MDVQVLTPNGLRTAKGDPDGRQSVSVEAISYPLSTVVATIPVSSSLSQAITLENNQRLARIIIPDNWTSALMTLQTSIDGVTWRDLYDSYGTEVTITPVIGADHALPLSDFSAIQMFRIRSGISAAPVNQVEEVDITLVVM